ncbi:MAG TPA: RHS repeat-associated core domain-containing protein, partial [Pseudobacteroides sp.]|nr:RHS repeat-associated core domain-containing protein [Pseudobacteroides sp.]
TIRGHELLAHKEVTGKSYYYVNNAHGDVTALVDGRGDVVNRYRYDAFGNTVEAVEKVQNRFRYAGEQFDPVTGQYYLRARFYNPVIGRFTQEDTYRGDGLNLYAYVANNPVKYVDPSGYSCESKNNVYNDDRTEIYNNLRNETQAKLAEWTEEAKDLENKNRTLSMNQLKPAFSTSYNVKTNKYYYARNMTKLEVTEGKIIYHPYVKNRIENMDSKIYEVYKDKTHGAGSHAECLTLNESMLDQFCMENNIARSDITQAYIDKLYKESPEKFNQNPNDTIINVVNSVKLNNNDLAIPGRPMPRCPHCKHITLESDVLEEVLEVERDYYAKRFPDLIF